MRNPQRIAAQHVRRLVVFGHRPPNFAIVEATCEPNWRGFIDSG